MTAYIVRRLLLMIPTLLGITIACFILIQFVPGGPVEQYISRIQGYASERGSASDRRISEAEVANIKAYFGFDQPAHVRYFLWLGNLLQGDFGRSYIYHEPVLQVILSKMPLSLMFGFTSLILSYLISIPLGVAKAMRNESPFDVITSILMFAGYVMPGFALGILLIIFFGGGSYLNWFPISGLVSDNYESLSPVAKGIDVLHHMVLPLICFMIGQFAFLTLLTKNGVMEELNKDYLRTVLAKGVPYRVAVWRHALRNALIPIVTDLGGIFTVMFTGALLIERVFDLDGMGLLFYNAIVGRDYNLVLGLIVLISFFTVLGRLFSDLCYMAVDPRIRLD